MVFLSPTKVFEHGLELLDSIVDQLTSMIAPIEGPLHSQT